MKPSAKEIKNFITEKIPEFNFSGEPVELSGGNLNYVWRVPSIQSSVIVKHAPPYITSNPEEPLDPGRLHFEAEALRLFTENGKLRFLTENDISPPHFLGYNPEKKLLLMEDAGTNTSLFSENMFQNATDSMPVTLGRFIAGLHKKTAGKAFFKENFRNLGIQKTRFHVQYCGAEQFLKNAGITPDSKAVKNAELLGEELLAPGTCLIMGDLWPPSVLTEGHRIHIIDWEFCHYGRPLQDIAHFIAHCRMHKEASDDEFRKKQIQRFRNHFLKNYKSGLGNSYPALFNENEIRGCNIHYAMELLIRTTGVFKQGYLFEKYPATHPKVQALAHEAYRHLKNPGNEEVFSV